MKKGLFAPMVLIINIFSLVACQNTSVAPQRNETLNENRNLASEPINVSSGNGHLTAIHDSIEFDLKLEDGRIFKFTKEGRNLNADGRIYDCKVTRHGNSWGHSEMHLDCTGGMSIWIIAKPNKESINGILLIGPNNALVEVERNWYPKKRMSEVTHINFDLIRHKGWITEH